MNDSQGKDVRVGDRVMVVFEVKELMSRGIWLQAADRKPGQEELVHPTVLINADLVERLESVRDGGY